MNLKEIVTKKRINKDEKIYISRLILDQALNFIEKEGEFIEMENAETKPKGAKKGLLDILYTTPFNKLYGANYILDIWCKEKGKVFSAHWSDINELDIVNLKRGNWITELFK